MKRPRPDDIFAQLIETKKAIDALFARVEILEKTIIDFLSLENAYVAEEDK